MNAVVANLGLGVQVHDGMRGRQRREQALAQLQVVVVATPREVAVQEVALREHDVAENGPVQDDPVDSAARVEEELDGVHCARDRLGREGWVDSDARGEGGPWGPVRVARNAPYVM